MATTHKPRSARRKVRLHGRLRGEREWVDLSIRDLSERGLMAETDKPPPRGHYVEIRRQGHILIGVVVWSKGKRFGASLADSTDIDALISGSSSAPSKDRRNRATRPNDKRVLVLTSPSDWRWLGKAFERCSLAIFVAVAGFFLAMLAYDAIAAPIDKIENVMANKQ